MRFKHEKVKPSQIEIDPTYQRELDDNRAQQIANDLREADLGTWVVSRRNDGRLFIIDGQHRRAGCVMAGFDRPVLCQVFEGLSLEEEATLFRRLNQNRKAVHAYDNYKAGLAAKDPTVCGIDAIVKGHGLRVSRALTASTICAVKALEKVYHRGHLNEVIGILRGWSQGDATAFDGQIIRAISDFLVEYGGQYNENVLRRGLDRVSPAYVLRSIRGAAGISKHQAYVSVLLSIYNKKTAKQYQLKTKVEAARAA